MSKMFIFLFSGMMLSQILLAARPSEIGLPILFHVGSLGMFLIFGLLVFLKEEAPLHLDPQAQMTMLYLAYFFTFGVAISIFNGVNLLGSIEYPYRICNLLMILVIPFFVRREEDVNRLFVMMMILVALVTIRDMGFWTVKEDENIKSALRIVGPEFSASYISLIPFAFAGLGAYWNAKTYCGLKRILLLIFWSLLVVKVFLSFSRVIWLMVPINIAVVLFLLRRKMQTSIEFRQWGARVSKFIMILALVSVVAVVLVAIFVPQISDFILLRQQLTGDSASNRLAEYQNALQEWLKSPIWGQGFGYKTELFKGSRWREQDYVHNFIFQFLQSGGLIGLGLVLALLGVPFFRLLKLFKRSRSLLQTAVLLASIVILLNIGIAGLVYTLLLKQDTYFILAVVISFTIIIGRLQGEEERRHGTTIRLPRGSLPLSQGRPPGGAAPGPKR